MWSALPRALAGAALVILASCDEGGRVPTSPDAPEPTWAEDLTLPAAPLNYSRPALPPYLLVQPIQNQLNTPPTNPVTDWGASVGRVLFYDRQLSANQTVACASCHSQAHGFSDSARVSAGFQPGQCELLPERTVLLG
jgi:cytochrome c peroxidase